MCLLGKYVETWSFLLYVQPETRLLQGAGWLCCVLAFAFIEKNQEEGVMSCTILSEISAGHSRHPFHLRECAMTFFSCWH